LPEGMTNRSNRPKAAVADRLDERAGTARKRSFSALRAEAYFAPHWDGDSAANALLRPEQYGGRIRLHADTVEIVDRRAYGRLR
jgi:hypothetical protein